MVERSLRRGEGRGIGMAAYVQSPPSHPCIPYNSGPAHTCSCMNNFWSNINWCIRSGKLSCSREKGALSVPGGVGLFRLLLVAPTTCRSILPSSSGVGPFRLLLVAPTTGRSILPSCSRCSCSSTMGSAK
jgi:hypothetical protein